MLRSDSVKSGSVSFLDARPLHDRGDDVLLLVDALLDARCALVHIAQAPSQGAGKREILQSGPRHCGDHPVQIGHALEGVEQRFLVGVGKLRCELISEVLVMSEFAK